MENPYKRKKEPEHNKQLILDAAVDICAAADWHQVTFQAIADKTGLSKGGIIHHFRSKEELLDELMENSLQQVMEGVSDYLQKTKTDNKAIAYLQFIINNSDNDRYRQTWRLILKVSMVNNHYREQWDTWFRENILGKKKPAVNDLITLLVADAIWYGVGNNFSFVNKKQQLEILKTLNSM